MMQFIQRDKMKLTPYTTGENALCLLDMPSLRSTSLCEKLARSKNVNISCLEDENLNAKAYKCEIGSSSFVLALLAKLACADTFSNLDEGYLSAESCLGEEEAKEILEFLPKANFLIFDKSLLSHKDFDNIAFFMGVLCDKFTLKLTCSDENIDEIQTNQLSELKELDNFDGLVLCRGGDDEILRCSKQFLQIAKVQNGDEVSAKSAYFAICAKIQCDERLQGTVGFLNFKEKGFDFVKVSIARI